MNIKWKRQDQINMKEREIFKQQFLDSLLNDKTCNWKYVIIDGIKTDYMISNTGRLASLKMCRDMKPAAGSDGYLETVIRVNGEKRNVAIHRLVALAFIPNPEHLAEVNHKDGNKNNNNVWNLEWMTHYDNVIHAIETGLRDNYLPKKYSKKKIHKVCKLLEKGLDPSEISKRTGVSKSVIKSIRRGKSWKYISREYNIPGLNCDTRLINPEVKEQTSTTTESLPFEETFYYEWEVSKVEPKLMG